MTTTTLFLTRHGQTEWNVEQKHQGWLDSPLTPLGIDQAKALSKVLSKETFAAIYTSSSPRSIRTAQLIRGDKETEMIVCDDLREINMGVWEGIPKKDVAIDHSESYHAFWHEPHLYQPVGVAESFFHVQKRALAVIESTLTKHAGESVLIVTHTATLKLIMTHFENRPLAQLWDPPFIHPTSLSKVIFQDGTPTIVQFGDTSHCPSSKPKADH